MSRPTPYTPTANLALILIGALLLFTLAGAGIVLKFFDARGDSRNAAAVFDGIEPTAGQDAAVVKQYASLAQDFFKEPFEIVVFVFWPDLEGMSFSTQHEKIVNVPISEMCAAIEKAGWAIEDVAFCIHNHFTPIGFTPGDVDAYQHLRRRGFKGRFGIYYTALGRIRWMEDKR